MAKPLTDYKVLTFDCYGTLIDWEGGIWDAFQPILMANQRSDINRSKLLEAFAVAESGQQAETPGMLYASLLEHVHRKLAEKFNLQTTAQLDADFGQSVPLWPAFADTADALRLLKTHYKLVILSNVDRAGFAASNRKLGVEFDAIYTAEDIGSYKPTPANFEYMLEHLQKDLGLGKGDILHTAQSLFHDHVQAKAFGLDNVWIDRQRLSESENWGATAKVEKRPEIDYLFFSMGEMTQTVSQA